MSMNIANLANNGWVWVGGYMGIADFAMLGSPRRHPRISHGQEGQEMEGPVGAVPLSGRRWGDSQ